MRKAVAVLILVLVLLAMAGSQVNFVIANPGMYMYPIADQTLVSVNAPENCTTQKMRWLNVNFTVDLSEWTSWGVPIFNPDYSFSSSVTCYLDSKPVWHKTLNSAEKHDFWFTLNDLSDGVHSINVNATTIGTHFETDPEWNLTGEPVLNSSGVVFFTVDTTPPNLTILGLENKIYYSSDIEFTFNVSETSVVTYSLDGNENVTLSENTVLSDLTEGRHNATFFATDKTGNTCSQTIYFSLEEPFPTVPVAAVSAASITVVATGLLLLTRRKRRREATQK